MTTEAKPWKVGDPSPAGGGELVHYRPATKEEWEAYTHRETPSALPPRVDNATPQQIAALGELWVDEATGYKTRVKPDAGAGDQSGAQTESSGTRSDAGAGTDVRNGRTRRSEAKSGAASGQGDPGDEVARLRAENERLRAGGAGGQ